MANLGDFENGEEVLGDYSPIPPGKYTAVLVESELLQNKNGTGSYLKLKFQVMGGQYDGRNVWQNMTYKHTNAQAQQIGRKELNTLRLACGVPDLKDSTQLHGIAHQIEVKIEQSDGYDPQNVIKNYYAIQGTPPVAPTQDVQAAPAPQASSATPDWAS